jgi:hypothetical protein
MIEVPMEAGVGHTRARDTWIDTGAVFTTGTVAHEY